MKYTIIIMTVCALVACTNAPQTNVEIELLSPQSENTDIDQVEAIILDINSEREIQ